MKFAAIAVLMAASFALCVVQGNAAQPPQLPVRRIVDAAIRPLMLKDRIPGMAVGLTIAGHSYVFDYGLASREDHRPVTRDTLFELGSVTKTFTATLASWAQAVGVLSLSDKTSKYLPALRHTPFGNVTLLELGTHTPGGLPLQVPDTITTQSQFIDYLKAWRPQYVPGTYRTYSNPGIGTLGLIAAISMHRDFTTLMERRLFAALGLKHTFIDVPGARIAQYAQGYTPDGKPIRMSPGVLSSEAYGIKSTAADVVRFLQANMEELNLDPKLQRALVQTHTAYFKAGPMVQDLIWEQYRYPVALNRLQQGNSPAMIFKATPVSRITPPEKPPQDVWLNKTGSTNGFGAYVAFIPEERLGIVILANKNFPIADRVTAAYGILTSISARNARRSTSQRPKYSRPLGLARAQ